MQEILNANFLTITLKVDETIKTDKLIIENVYVSICTF